MNIRIRLFAALSIALLAAGCGLFSESRPAPAPMLEPGSDAVVVLFHTHLGEPADDWTTDHNVYIDDVRVGRLNEGEELRLRIAPGVRQLNIRHETMWLGSARKDPIKYNLQAAKGSTHYLRYRTSTGQGRIAPITGTVYADRELSLVTEREYDARR